MFDDWRQRRKLSRDLRELDEAFAPRFREAKKDEDYYPLRDEYDGSTADIVGALRGMETREARNRAERFGVDLPAFDFDDHSVNWEMLLVGRSALTPTAIAKINRQVSEARFAYWERWARLLIPILSLLIAIIALLVKNGRSATH